MTLRKAVSHIEVNEGRGINMKVRASVKKSARIVKLLPRNKEMKIALRSLYGVGPKLAKDILSQCNIEPVRGQRTHTNVQN